MRGLAIVGVLVAGVAGADESMPGVGRVGAASTLDPGLAIGASAGYGYTENLVGEDDTHHRTRAAAAASYRPNEIFALGLRLDGRWDKHVESPGDDDGFVGEARLGARARIAAGSALSVGAQAALWFPGDISPSPELLALATIAGLLHVNAGFRLDRSGETVDDPDMLSPGDRLAIGASEANAVLLGLGTEIRIGGVTALATWTWDLLVGQDAPPRLESPMRAAHGPTSPTAAGR